MRISFTTCVCNVMLCPDCIGVLFHRPGLSQVRLQQTGEKLCSMKVVRLGRVVTVSRRITECFQHTRWGLNYDIHRGNCPLEMDSGAILMVESDFQSFYIKSRDRNNWHPGVKSVFLFRFWLLTKIKWMTQFDLDRKSSKHFQHADSKPLPLWLDSLPAWPAGFSYNTRP